MGPYRRRFPGGPFTCWDGTRWIGDAIDAATAARSSKVSIYQRVPWQGLDASTEETCKTCRGHGAVDEGENDASGWPLVDPCPDC